MHEAGEKREMEAPRGAVWVLSSARPSVLKAEHKNGGLVVAVASSDGRSI